MAAAFEPEADLNWESDNRTVAALMTLSLLKQTKKNNLCLGMKHIFDAICKLFDFIKSAQQKVDIGMNNEDKKKTFVWSGFQRITEAFLIRILQTIVEN